MLKNTTAVKIHTDNKTHIMSTPKNQLSIQHVTARIKVLDEFQHESQTLYNKLPTTTSKIQIQNSFLITYVEKHIWLKKKME